jgi:hypothetical protein
METPPQQKACISSHQANRGNGGRSTDETISSRGKQEGNLARATLSILGQCNFSRALRLTIRLARNRNAVTSQNGYWEIGFSSEIDSDRGLILNRLPTLP